MRLGLLYASCQVSQMAARDSLFEIIQSAILADLLRTDLALKMLSWPSGKTIDW